jgi:hypothetical protein
VLLVSERRACAALGQHRSTQRKIPQGRDDETRLTADIIELARHYGRYGYRKIAELLRRAGWLVNDKRVERIWRREGLKVPNRQPKRARLWLADGSCIRLRAERPNHVWSPAFARAGSMTFSRSAPMTDARSACSTSSTSSPTNAWPFGYPDGSTRSTSSTRCRICSSCELFPGTSAPTMARSSLPKRCRSGSAPSARRPPTSLPAARGDRLPRSGTRGVCASPRCLAGDALAGAKTGPKLTFKLDHQAGAGQARDTTIFHVINFGHSDDS